MKMTEQQRMTLIDTATLLMDQLTQMLAKWNDCLFEAAQRDRSLFKGTQQDWDELEREYNSRSVR